MGYWNTSADGDSLMAEDTGMLWGDQPADIIDSGMDKLIGQLHNELGRIPTVEEVDEIKFGESLHPIMFATMLMAGQAFSRDVGRVPTEAELEAGLRFSDTKIALESYRERHDVSD